MLGACKALSWCVCVCGGGPHKVSLTAQWSERDSVALCSPPKGRMSCLPQAWGFWAGWHAPSPHPTCLSCLQRSQDLCSSTSQGLGPVYLGAPWATVFR